MTASEILIVILYRLVGAIGALSVVVMVWGFITYIMRLGQVRREEGIHLMEWGVGLMITALILIGILHLFERWLS